MTEEPGAGAPEIEIDFEEKGNANSGTSAEEALLEPVEELPEALEVPSGGSAKKPSRKRAPRPFLTISRTRSARC